jgi:hypothetical protein
VVYSERAPDVGRGVHFTPTFVRYGPADWSGYRSDRFPKLIKIDVKSISTRVVCGWYGGVVMDGKHKELAPFTNC